MTEFAHRTSARSACLFKRVVLGCAALALGIVLLVPSLGGPAEASASARAVKPAAAAVTASVTAAAAAPAHGSRGGVPVQLIALNDLHGNLDPVEGAAGRVVRGGGGGGAGGGGGGGGGARGSGVQAGGVPQLATLVEKARAGQPNSLTVGAGDMIGGSPLLSALFHDEPTVEALEQLGLGVSSVGNHEFDEGARELERMAGGGCHPEDGCAPGGGYNGADFPYLAANVTRKGSSEPLLRPYDVKRLPGGQRIGFIGLVTKDAPAAINSSQIRDLEFGDELPVVQRYSKELTRMGVKAQVLLVHEGEAAHGVAGRGDCDDGGPAAQLRGRIKGIAQKAPGAVDLVVSGHSHDSYECTVNDPQGKPRSVTQADSFGRSFTDLRFRLDGSGDVIRGTVSAKNRVVPVSTPKHPGMTDLVETWRKRSATVADRTVGYISGDLPGRGSPKKETPLGSLLADAQTEATADKGADLALLNPGGMRADLVHKDDGAVTYADAFRTQPFSTSLTTMTLTGTQLIAVLKEQFTGANADDPLFLQLSSGLRYSVDMSRSGGARLLTDTVRVKGERVRAGATYRVTANDFLASGGNGFGTFKKGAEREGGGVTDLDALVHYLEKHSSGPDSPVRPPAAGRITFLEGR
ncbi:MULTISPECIES: bifunctional metallophosphatase/5'-nucleotidase [unclassified Streptomyces]|uniref:bifunctional metallophosphatase/5'-nucleotidase n=1 Tax=unclassified Streptomyces TaxID=2593676 RepID=UPI0033CC9FB7